MTYHQKLKSRFYLAIIYVILGITMIATTLTTNTDCSSFGIVFVVIGIVRIRTYFVITHNEETIRKQQIAETDERNLSIQNNAKSLTFSIYVLLLGIAVIILSILNLPDAAKWTAFSICLLLVIYWITYWIYQKKS